MKKKISFFFFVGLFQLSFAQEVLSSQGESYEIPQQPSVNFTIGEAVTETLSSTTNDFTQGFHQTNWQFVSLEDFEPEFEISAYPNPFIDQLILDVSKYSGIRYQILDVSGKVIVERALQSEITTISTSEFAQGSYSLVLTGEEKLKIIKLIKNF